jgi:hypothetical protein
MSGWGDFNVLLMKLIFMFFILPDVFGERESKCLTLQA